MYAVISPAKKLNCSGWDRNLDFTHPSLISQTTKLVGEMKNKSADDIGKLMKISEKLATLNHERYQSFSKDVECPEAKPAALMFDGDTFTGLQADDFAEEDWNFAQQHLGILSGLYGLLRPLDLMQPYRLEMGLKLKTRNAADLYEFWGEKITDALNQLLEKKDNSVLINL